MPTIIDCHDLDPCTCISIRSSLVPRLAFVAFLIGLSTSARVKPGNEAISGPPCLHVHGFSEVTLICLILDFFGAHPCLDLARSALILNLHCSP